MSSSGKTSAILLSVVHSDRHDDAAPVAAAVLPQPDERVRLVVGGVTVVRGRGADRRRRLVGAHGRSIVRRSHGYPGPVSDAPVQPVLVLDFGAQYAQLIARRVREARVYSEVIPSTTPVAEILARRPLAVILSGGPSSVYAEGAPQVDPALFDAGVPAFGICYGHQAMAVALGGRVEQTGLSEFGATPLDRDRAATRRSSAACPPSRPSGCPTATRWPRRPRASSSPRRRPAPRWPAFEDLVRRHAGVQFHPEVLHTAHGQAVLEHFLYDVAGHRAHLDPGEHRRGAGRADPRPGRWQAGHLRAVRRRRLGRRRRPRAPGGR